MQHDSDHDSDSSNSLLTAIDEDDHDFDFPQLTGSLREFDQPVGFGEADIRQQLKKQKKKGNIFARCTAGCSRGIQAFYSTATAIMSILTHIASLFFFVWGLMESQHNHSIVCATPVWLWLMIQNLCGFPCATWSQVIIRKIFDVDTSPDKLAALDRRADPRPVRIFKRIFWLTYLAWQVLGWYIYFKARATSNLPEYFLCDDKFLDFVEIYLLYFSGVLFIFLVLPTIFFMVLLILSLLERCCGGSRQTSPKWQELPQNEESFEFDGPIPSGFSSPINLVKAHARHNKEAVDGIRQRPRCVLCHDLLLLPAAIARKGADGDEHSSASSFRQRLEYAKICRSPLASHRAHVWCAKKARQAGLSCPLCFVGDTGGHLKQQ